ncbi:hypothetical protein [Paenibacillus polymyxa]|uniref:hypothetical protein n=1 Tax=Paenibacillus polymyxa TaxID=1406 RepID=UPI00287FAD5B|nr:hypothetical protein [Paenibacillus polymyxa]
MHNTEKMIELKNTLEGLYELKQVYDGEGLAYQLRKVNKEIKINEDELLEELSVKWNAFNEGERIEIFVKELFSNQTAIKYSVLRWEELSFRVKNVLLHSEIRGYLNQLK